MSNKKIYLLSIMLGFCLNSNAAINAQYSFEDTLPKFVSTTGNASAAISPERFKDGTSSLKFSWEGEAALVFSNGQDIEASMKVNWGGIIVWIYNPSPSETGSLRFAIAGWDGKEICHFHFNMNFKGWRTAWLKYADMHVGDDGDGGSTSWNGAGNPTNGAEKYYGDIPAAEREVMAAKMTVTPIGMDEGTIYIDRLTFSKTRLSDQICPDMQVPDNNHGLRRNMWQWARLWEWEQYPPVTGPADGQPSEQPSEQPQAQTPTLTETALRTLATIEERLDRIVTSEIHSTPNISSRQYVAGTLLPRADAMYEKYELQRQPDGTVLGAPLLSDDEFNNSLGEMRIRFIGQIVFWYAQDYLYTGNKSNLDKVFTAIDHAIEQGFAFGSGLGTNHHYGYQVRELYKGMWLLRKEIAAAGRMDEYLKVLEYWSALAETRLPFQDDRDEILDSWNTLNLCKIISAMMNPDPVQRYAKMEALAGWLSGSIRYTAGTLGGIKIDGSTFHHGGMYPAYSVGAFASLGEWCYLVRDTPFVPDEGARRCLKHALLTMRNYCNLTDWGLAACGRHPFNGSIQTADIEAFAALALLGDLTSPTNSTAIAPDPELGGAYLALGGSNPEMVSALRKAKIPAAPAPEGFFVINYGALGIHRRGDWMLSLKAFNTDVWSSEIYAADNRYGRYLSYGSAILLGSGRPVSERASGYVQEGWDWNRIPGTTTIHLPFDRLESPNKGTLMERNTARFPGVSSLEGRNGVLAFTYVEAGLPNFCAGATATKSVFCFDNRIVFLGSGITNDSTEPTETTLFQLALESKDEELYINDESITAFPFSRKQTGHGQTVLHDTKGNTYIIKDGLGLNVVKQSQTSPDDTKTKKDGTGNFVTAYIDHGTAPKEASYEYLLLISPTVKEINRHSKKLPYTVIRQDNGAHIVNDHETGITAYVCYSAYEAEDSKEGLEALAREKDAKPALKIASIDAETIVMERATDNGTIIMSVCTPDLGLTEKTYTTAQPSQPLTRKVVVEGDFSLSEPSDRASIAVSGGMTVISVICKGGQPTEFSLTMN